VPLIPRRGCVRQLDSRNSRSQNLDIVPIQSTTSKIFHATIPAREILFRRPSLADITPACQSQLRRYFSNSLIILSLQLHAHAPFSSRAGPSVHARVGTSGSTASTHGIRELRSDHSYLGAFLRPLPPPCLLLQQAGGIPEFHPSDDTLLSGGSIENHSSASPPTTPQQRPASQQPSTVRLKAPLTIAQK